MAESGLADPPDVTALTGFPAAGHVAELHRLSEYVAPWWFASSPVEADSGGRFDLPAPLGTCYTAETLDGALVEKLLRTAPKVVVGERLGELFHTVITVRVTRPHADLTAPVATGFGVNAEIHTTLDYSKPRRWAAALHSAGWRGLRHRLRGDASATRAGRALFGRAGLYRRAQRGMRTQVAPLDRAHAERLLASRGVMVRPIPSDVPVETA